MNSFYYLEFMPRLLKVIRQKSIALKKPILHHDKAVAHTSMHVREFLVKNKIAVMPLPSYSPDLTPADFFLFTKLKTPMKEKIFEKIEE